MRAQIYYQARILQSSGHAIICYCIPGHFGLEGNKKAGLTAKNKTGKGGKQAERWSLLACIKENLAQVRGKKLAKWHQEKT